MKPLAIDLFCGLGGWTEGLLAEGYDVVGFDIERHQYPQKCPLCQGTGNFYRNDEDGDFLECDCYENHDHYGTVLQKYPAQLVLADVQQLHGKQFRDAALIVASPPCQAYSHMAMPWSRAKAIAEEIRADVRRQLELNCLFNNCFRIQHQASEAAGRHIPMVVENVKGAQPWVGRARWNYKSFYLWGDVPAIMPNADKGFKGFKGFKKNWRDCEASRSFSSHSKERKEWSAKIAKIPLPLSRWIARVYAQ